MSKAPAWARQGKGEKMETAPSKEFSPRFWMKKGEGVEQDDEVYITFCDEEPLLFYEHSLKVGKKFGYNVTCMKNLGEECPLCEAGHYAPNVAVFTVIDHRSITDKNNKVHQDEKKLFVAKSSTWSVLELKKQRLEQKGLSMKGATFRVARTNAQKSPNAGNDFDFEGHVDGNDYDLEPLDYEKYLAPDAEYAAHMAKKAAKPTDWDDNEPVSKPKSSKPKFD